MRDILAWIITVEIVGLVVLPLLRLYFGSRLDAALLSRTVGLAVVGYVGWLFSLGLGFSRGTLILALVAVAILSIWVHRRFRMGVASERFWGPEESRAARYFWIAAGIFALIRAAVPEILGQEKFMDLAFLNSLTRNAAMPPRDPWMSGLSINYYYWGYLLAAALTKLSGASTYLTYNLALATFAGYSFAPAAALGLRLSAGRRGAAIGAGFGAVFAGNLAGAFDVATALRTGEFNYFSASRVIASGDTINEFPFFTFFHADLHPHLLAFPFFLAAFALGHRFLNRPEAPEDGKSGFGQYWPILLIGLVAGTAVAANKWNAPAIALLLFYCAVGRLARPAASRDFMILGTAFLLTLIAAVIGYGIVQFAVSIVSPDLKNGLIPPLVVLAGLFLLWKLASSSGTTFTRQGVLTATLFALLLLTSLTLFRLYEMSYSLPFHGLAHASQTSGLLEFLGVWGLFFAVAIPALWPSEVLEGARRRSGLILASAAFAALVVSFVIRAKPAGGEASRPIPALVPILFLAFLAARLAWRDLREKGAPALRSSDSFVSLLLLLALAMIAGCEFVYFRDPYGDRLQRMNTIFKFYHQAWPLLAIATAVVVEKRWRQAGRGFRIAVAAAGLLALLYPVEAALQRLRQHFGEWTLSAHPALVRRNAADAAAIDWLRRKPGAQLALLEATGGPYSEFARISTHSGIPTVLGWANHEGLWREHNPEVELRASSVKLFYTTQDSSAALEILRRYHVTHVIVGGLESRTYPEAEAVAALPFLRLAFPGPTSIFEVSAAPPTR